MEGNIAFEGLAPSDGGNAFFNNYSACFLWIKAPEGASIGCGRVDTRGREPHVDLCVSVDGFDYRGGHDGQVDHDNGVATIDIRINPLVDARFGVDDTVPFITVADIDGKCLL